MPDRPFSDDELDRAVAALTEPGRFEQAEARVARVAPQLQRVLNEALGLGTYFGQLREGELSAAVRKEDLDERALAMRTLLAEETRLGMLVGVAVGWELARELEMKEDEK